MTFIHFPKESECNSQVEFKLDNYNVTIQHVSYYTMTILPSSIFNTAICLICKCLYLPNPSAIGRCYTRSIFKWIRTIMNYLMLKFDWLISQVGRVFTNGSGDWGSISGQVIPKTQKWYGIPPCLTLDILRYVSRVKWSNPGKGAAHSPTPWCSSYWKGSLRVTLNYGQLTTMPKSD